MKNNTFQTIDRDKSDVSGCTRDASGPGRFLPGTCVSSRPAIATSETWSLSPCRRSRLPPPPESTAARFDATVLPAARWADGGSKACREAGHSCSDIPSDGRRCCSAEVSNRSPLRFHFTARSGGLGFIRKFEVLYLVRRGGVVGCLGPSGRADLVCRRVGGVGFVGGARRICGVWGWMEFYSLE